MGTPARFHSFPGRLGGQGPELRFQWQESSPARWAGGLGDRLPYLGAQTWGSNPIQVKACRANGIYLSPPPHQEVVPGCSRGTPPPSGDVTTRPTGMRCFRSTSVAAHPRVQSPETSPCSLFCLGPWCALLSLENQPLRHQASLGPWAGGPHYAKRTLWPLTS